MQPHSLLDQILPILSAVRNDKEKLTRILTFLESEILPQIEEEEDNEIKIPDKYEALVHTIADNIFAGLICHLNMDTLELENYPANVDPEEWEASTGEIFVAGSKHLERQNLLSFEPLDSPDSFRIMENFVEQLDNDKVQNTLIDIMNKGKPFAHFNSYIHYSKYREDWFKFRITAPEKHVREMIYDKLNEAHG